MTGTRMYACICNAINDRKVSEAMAGGASSVADIFKHHGCAPRCGACVSHMRERFVDASQSQLASPSLTDLPLAAD